MTQGEYHQQQLERQEQDELAYIENPDGTETRFHIYGEDETVYFHMDSYPIKIGMFLSIEQTEVMIKLLNNALRRAK